MKTIYRNFCERICQRLIKLTLSYTMLLTLSEPLQKIASFSLDFLRYRNASSFNTLLNVLTSHDSKAWDAGSTEMKQFKYTLFKLCVLGIFVLEISASASKCEDAKLCDDCLVIEGCQGCSLSQKCIISQKQREPSFREDTTPFPNS